VAYGTVLQEQRKRLHERTGQALETVYAATLPEHYSDLAHHYRRSANTEKAIAYLPLAGQQAVQRSANPEAISHFTAALELLMTRPETPERAGQELTLRLAVGPVLMSAQGWSAPAVEPHYTRARELCAQLGDIPQRFPVLWGLWAFHWNRGDLHTAQALAEECLQIAEPTNEARLLIPAHHAVGTTFLRRGELVRARAALEQSVALYQPQHHTLTPLYGSLDPKVFSLDYTARALWFLGYPEQARTQVYDALRLAQEINHSSSLVCALGWTAWLHSERGDGHIAQERADALVVLASDQGFSEYLAWGTILRGAALIVQGQWVEGVTQVQQVLETYETENTRPTYLTWLARGYGGVGQVEDGLAAVAEALRLVEKNDERYYEAEVYRVKGELALQSKTSLKQVSDKSQTSQEKSEDPNTQHPTPNTQSGAEACFHKAIAIAQKQQAKSLELRAVMSLARLWQSQGKTAEARQMLAEIYGWFTEGFDTADLKDAKGLLAELA
jgi:predicted ATPase